MEWLGEKPSRLFSQTISRFNGKAVGKLALRNEGKQRKKKEKKRGCDERERERCSESRDREKNADRKQRNFETRLVFVSEVRVVD